MSKVCILKCETYEQSVVDKVVNDLINSVVDLKTIIKPNTNVVLKVNLVAGISPDKNATTHPSIVISVAKIIKSLGANCIIADSSGGLYNSAYMNSVYKQTKMTDVAKITGAKLNDDFTYEYLENPNAVMHKKIPIINVLNNADLIINMSKLKTHTFMGYSGAVKNMFGSIPGLMKVEMHGNFKDQFSFSNHLIDIFETLKSKICLNIVDGIEGMEGDGPTSGTTIKMNCLLASTNAYELDYVLTKIMDIDSFKMPLIQQEQKRGLLSIEEIEYLGDNYESFVKKEFNNVEIQVYNKNNKKVPPFLNGFVHKLLTRRPIIKKSKCKGCKKCFDHCPVKAIEMCKKKDNKQYAKVNYDKCIRCFCCQELCPFHVVKIKTGILYNFVHKKK